MRGRVVATGGTLTAHPCAQSALLLRLRSAIYYIFMMLGPTAGPLGANKCAAQCRWGQRCFGNMVGVPRSPPPPLALTRNATPHPPPPPLPSTPTLADIRQSCARVLVFVGAPRSPPPLALTRNATPPPRVRRRRAAASSHHTHPC